MTDGTPEEKLKPPRLLPPTAGVAVVTVLVKLKETGVVVVAVGIAEGEVNVKQPPVLVTEVKFDEFWNLNGAVPKGPPELPPLVSPEVLVLGKGKGEVLAVVVATVAVGVICILGKLKGELVVSPLENADFTENTKGTEAAVVAAAMVPAVPKLTTGMVTCPIVVQVVFVGFVEKSNNAGAVVVEVVGTKLKTGIDFAGTNTDDVVVEGAGKTELVFVVSGLEERLNAGGVSVDGAVDDSIPTVVLIDTGFAEVNIELTPEVDGAVIGAVFLKLKPD